MLTLKASTLTDIVVVFNPITILTSILSLRNMESKRLMKFLISMTDSFSYGFVIIDCFN